MTSAVPKSTRSSISILTRPRPRVSRRDGPSRCRRLRAATRSAAPRTFSTIASPATTKKKRVRDPHAGPAGRGGYSSIDSSPPVPPEDAGGGGGVAAGGGVFDELPPLLLEPPLPLLELPPLLLELAPPLLLEPPLELPPLLDPPPELELTPTSGPARPRPGRRRAHRLLALSTTSAEPDSPPSPPPSAPPARKRGRSDHDNHDHRDDQCSHAQPPPRISRRRQLGAGFGHARSRARSTDWRAEQTPLELPESAAFEYLVHAAATAPSASASRSRAALASAPDRRAP